jgi:hypothetical protein
MDINEDARHSLDMMAIHHKRFMEEFAKDNFDSDKEGYDPKNDPYMAAYLMAGKITRAILPTIEVPPKPKTVGSRVFAKALLFSFTNPNDKKISSKQLKKMLQGSDFGTLGTTLDEV